MHFSLLLVGWTFISPYEIILILFTAITFAEFRFPCHAPENRIHVPAWQHGGKGGQPVAMLQN